MLYSSLYEVWEQSKSGIYCGVIKKPNKKIDYWVCKLQKRDDFVGQEIKCYLVARCMKWV